MPSPQSQQDPPPRHTHTSYILPPMNGEPPKQISYLLPIMNNSTHKHPAPPAFLARPNAHLTHDFSNSDHTTFFQHQAPYTQSVLLARFGTPAAINEERTKRSTLHGEHYLSLVQRIETDAKALEYLSARRDIWESQTCANEREVLRLKAEIERLEGMNAEMRRAEERLVGGGEMAEVVRREREGQREVRVWRRYLDLEVGLEEVLGEVGRGGSRGKVVGGVEGLARRMGKKGSEKGSEKGLPQGGEKEVAEGAAQAKK